MDRMCISCGFRVDFVWIGCGYHVDTKMPGNLIWDWMEGTGADVHACACIGVHASAGAKDAILPIHKASSARPRGRGVRFTGRSPRDLRGLPPPVPRSGPLAKHVPGEGGPVEEVDGEGGRGEFRRELGNEDGIRARASHPREPRRAPPAPKRGLLVPATTLTAGSRGVTVQRPHRRSSRRHLGQRILHEHPRKS